MPSSQTPYTLGIRSSNVISTLNPRTSELEKHGAGKLEELYIR